MIDFGLEGTYVACNSFALAVNGLVFASTEHIDLMTAFEELDGIDLVYLSYFYNAKIDKVYEVSVYPKDEHILIPSKERAIVEYIINQKWCDEGLLIEALRSYIDQFWDEEKLFTAADYFELSRDTLNYWLEEARNAEDD